MVVFSDMHEPDSLFLLTGVSGEVSFFSNNFKQLKFFAFISSSKHGVIFYLSLCDVDSHALTAKWMLWVWGWGQPQTQSVSAKLWNKTLCCT